MTIRKSVSVELHFISEPSIENDDIIITIRLLVKGNKVGTIIGKGGDRITAMRKGCCLRF